MGLTSLDTMSVLSVLATHKTIVIATAAALVLLTAYVIPFDLLFGIASGAKAGNNGNDNPNRFKVCEKKEAAGKDQHLPKKCYGITD
jgi:hypothetical protein